MSPAADGRVSPDQREHSILTYTDDAFLARVVGDYLADGLALGEATIAIATPAHLQTFQEGLLSDGVAIDAPIERGQLVFLDAEPTLARFLIDDEPDRSTFGAVVGKMLERVRAAGFPAVRCFGEAVDLLRRRNLGATARLETLWNEVSAGRALSLLCAYRVEPFTRDEGALHEIVACHSQRLPDQHAADFEEAVERAWDDVLEAGGDVGARHGLVAACASMPAMSRAHAALFALREVSHPLSDRVVERARQHYRHRRGRGQAP
jgi:hypothetical protein